MLDQLLFGASPDAPRNDDEAGIALLQAQRPAALKVLQQACEIAGLAPAVRAHDMWRDRIGMSMALKAWAEAYQAARRNTDINDENRAHVGNRHRL